MNVQELQCSLEEELKSYEGVCDRSTIKPHLDALQKLVRFSLGSNIKEAECSDAVLKKLAEDIDWYNGSVQSGCAVKTVPVEREWVEHIRDALMHILMQQCSTAQLAQDIRSLDLRIARRKEQEECCGR